MRTFVKRAAELAFWVRRRAAEGRLTNDHYEFLFTTHFGIDRGFYAGSKVLDVGCGPRGSLEWASHAAERVGLDPLADRYRRLGASGHAMSYVNAGAEDIPFPDDYFDVVSSFNSLDHVDRLDAAVGEICRVIKPGGLLLLITDVNHEPTLTEPLSFGWDVVERFVPPLHIRTVRRYAKTDGMYRSLREARPYEERDGARPPGILSAVLSK